MKSARPLVEWPAVCSVGFPRTILITGNESFSQKCEWQHLPVAFAGTGAFFLESTFIDQNNPKRQTAGPLLAPGGPSGRARPALAAGLPTGTGHSRQWQQHARPSRSYQVRYWQGRGSRACSAQDHASDPRARPPPPRPAWSARASSAGRVTLSHRTWVAASQAAWKLRALSADSAQPGGRRGAGGRGSAVRLDPARPSLGPGARCLGLESPHELRRRVCPAFSLPVRNGPIPRT